MLKVTALEEFSTFVQFYSSQEWTTSTVDSATAYLGLWGHSVEYCNDTIVLLAGDKGGGGSLESRTWGGLAGFYCDMEGIVCSNAGESVPQMEACTTDVPVPVAIMVSTASILPMAALW